MYKESFLQLPPETRLEGNILPVIEAARGIGVLEFGSETPGDCFVFTQGVHGEETLGDGKILDLLQKFLETGVTFINGKIYLIPNLNDPGCQAKTRYVFKDEPDTHLNNVFDQYQAGTIQELVSLGSKTAMYGWLVMHGLTAIKDQHRKQHGQDRRILHIDLHAEETAIPEVIVDRMDDDQEALQRLITGVRSIGLPFFLDYPSWREMGDNQILTAATAAHGFDSTATLEEGKTRDPDIFVRRFIAWKLLEHLEQLGFVRVNESTRQQHESMFDRRFLTPGLKKALEIWTTQSRGETIYCLDDILPVVTGSDGRRVSSRQLLTRACESQNCDGVLSLVYKPGLRGSRGKDGMWIANILYGAWIYLDYLTFQPTPNAFISIDNFPPDSWILSVAEPPDPEEKMITYAFFLDESEEKPKLRLDILDTEEKYRSFLNAARLREFMNSNPDIDLSILEITCAVPDSKWKGNFNDGEFALSPLH